MVEKALLKLPGVASANADKTTRSASVVYDKTVFKPEEIDTLGRYKFSLVNTGQSDASLSPSPSSATSSVDDTEQPPSQFDLGDFSDMKPAKEPAGGGGSEDELPLLGGPEANE